MRLTPDSKRIRRPSLNAEEAIVQQGLNPPKALEDRDLMVAFASLSSTFLPSIGFYYGMASTNVINLQKQHCKYVTWGDFFGNFQPFRVTYSWWPSFLKEDL